MEGEGVGVGLAGMSPNGIVSRLSLVEPRAICFAPVGRFRVRFPLFQSRLARLVTSPSREEDAVAVEEVDSRVALRRCLSVISHWRSVCGLFSG
jgi:hypothetical protein